MLVSTSRGCGEVDFGCVDWYQLWVGGLAPREAGCPWVGLVRSTLCMSAGMSFGLEGVFERESEVGLVCG